MVRTVLIHSPQRLSIPSQLNPVHAHKKYGHMCILPHCIDVCCVILTKSTNHFQCSVNRTVYCKQCSLRGTNLTLYTIYTNFSLQPSRWLLTGLALLQFPGQSVWNLRETKWQRGRFAPSTSGPLPPPITPMLHISHLNNTQWILTFRNSCALSDNG
jgi:hypothetical protein